MAESEIYYLSTDLDVVTPLDFSPLIEELEPKGVYTALPVYPSADEENYFAVFNYDNEIGKDDNWDHEPEKDIEKMVAAIESLSKESKLIWSKSVRLEFSIGYESGESPHCLYHILSNQLLKRIADLGARLSIAVYRDSKDDSNDSE